MTTTLPNKKVSLELVGLDSNAFSLMGAFRRQARKEKWTDDEIKFVLDKCISGDYNNLLGTLMSVCNPPDKDNGWDEEDED